MYTQCEVICRVHYSSENGYIAVNHSSTAQCVSWSPPHVHRNMLCTPCTQLVPTGVHCEVPTAVCCVHTPFVLWGGPHSSYHVHCTPCVLWSPPQQLPCTPCALWSPHSRGEFFRWGSEACWLRLNHCSAIDTLCNLSNFNLQSSSKSVWFVKVDLGLRLNLVQSVQLQLAIIV